MYAGTDGAENVQPQSGLSSVPISAGETRIASGSVPSTPLTKVVWPKKIAVVFGNEFAGMSEDALALADTQFHIETMGFVQSLNVSVAAAITFHTIASSTPAAVEIQGNAHVTNAMGEMFVREAMARGFSYDALLHRVQAHVDEGHSAA
eukprot:m.491301 g.491301  ORF g.491301 m.491301 type:complete len:149 (+) comp21784_c0_seq29:2976-3422(+)